MGWINLDQNQFEEDFFVFNLLAIFILHHKLSMTKLRKVVLCNKTPLYLAWFLMCERLSRIY